MNEYNLSSRIFTPAYTYILQPTCSFHEGVCSSYTTRSSEQYIKSTPIYAINTLNRILIYSCSQYSVSLPTLFMFKTFKLLLQLHSLLMGLIVWHLT